MPAQRPDRLARRLVQLYAGLVLYGLSAALILLSALGNDPWDVLHQGLWRQTGIGTGTWVCIVGALVLLLWIPLRQRPGLGTVANGIVVGIAIDATLRYAPTGLPLTGRTIELCLGLVLEALATGFYLACALGPGPRDGLMTGIHRVSRVSVWAVRGTLELSVLACGWLLGGDIGVGTLAFALSIGPGVAISLRLAGVKRPHEL
jgi:uncharacterized membrane protein YczE